MGLIFTVHKSTVKPSWQDGWQELTQVYASTTDQSLGFIKAQTFNSYFTTRIVDDGMAEVLVQADPSCNLVGIAKFKCPCAK